MLKITENGQEHDENVETHLDSLIRTGAQKMLRIAIESEVEEYVDRFRNERDESGHRRVVRNGKARPRKIVTGAGTLEVTALRINDKRVIEGERAKFTSHILPPYMRRSSKVPRSCRFCICEDCRPTTSGPLWRRCWARRHRACRRAPSRA